MACVLWAPRLKTPGHQCVSLRVPSLWGFKGKQQSQPFGPRKNDVPCRAGSMALWVPECHGCPLVSNGDRVSLKHMGGPPFLRSFLLVGLRGTFFGVFPEKDTHTHQFGLTSGRPPTNSFCLPLTNLRKTADPSAARRIGRMRRKPPPTRTRRRMWWLHKKRGIQYGCLFLESPSLFGAGLKGTQT